MFYVYTYLREDGTPYYVGKGKDKRAWYRSKRERIRKPKNESNIVIVKDNLTEEEAHELEINLISKYGRKDIGTGILRNKTDGGEGVAGAKFGKPSDETIEKIRTANTGKKFSDKTKEKMSRARLGLKDSDITKQKKAISASKPKTKEHIENIRKSKLGENNPMFGKTGPNKGKKMSEEQKEKIRQTLLNSLRVKVNSCEEFLK